MSDQEATRICSACGGHNAPVASFCGLCGHVLLEDAKKEDGEEVISESAFTFENAVSQQAPQSSPWQDTLVPLTPGDMEGDDSGSGTLEEIQAATQAPAESIMQKRCAWCSGLNPSVAMVCEVCGAHFPVPEQDAALQRAAEERIRQDEESLIFWRQRRKRGWRRFLM